MAACDIRNETLGLDIDRETATARWRGEPFDYDQGVTVMMAAARSTATRAELSPERAGSPDELHDQRAVS